MQAQTKFSDLGIDPIEGAEIVDLLGIGQHEFDIPQRFRKLSHIIKFFQGRPDKRWTILNIISGKPGNRLDLVWEWLSLMEEKQEILAGLEPEFFTEVIQGEIKGGHISLKNINTVVDQLNVREQELIKMGGDIKIKERDLERKEKVQEAANKASDKLSTKKVEELKSAMKQLTKVGEQISRLEA